MLTRRGMLTGVAAASIAAIATARDSATAQPIGGGLGFACGDVKADSALGSFDKHRTGFDVFLKFADSALAAYFRAAQGGGTNVFYKFFNKDWTPLANQFLKFDALDATRGSLAFDSTGAEFFLKYENEFVVRATFEQSLDGFLKFDVQEIGQVLEQGPLG